MYTLTKTFRFEASHQLPDHDGKCARLHGHSWVGHIIVSGGSLYREGPKRGMLVDYGDISAAVKPLVEDHLDHWHLNDSVPDAHPPTSEHLARWLFKQLKKTPIGDVLRAVIIEETCTARCEYHD